MSRMNVQTFLLATVFLIICISQIETRPSNIFRCAELILSRFERGPKPENTSADHFSYYLLDKNGPPNWPGVCNTGKAQSPIAYDLVSPVNGPTANPLRMIGAFDVLPTEVNVMNSGHGATYSLKFDGNSVPQITGGPLNNEVYNFESLHYHTPCEHLPLKYLIFCKFEVHFVHSNKKYGTLQNAINMPDGLAVIGVMHQVGIKRNSRTIPFLPQVKYVYEPDTEYKTSTNVFTYADAVGFKTFPRYISYKGSLTTPGCYESVTWIVIDRLYQISEDDLRAFQKIKDDYGNIIKFNNRPVQPINGRTITRYNSL